MEQKRKLYKDTTQQPLWGIRKLTINPIDKDDLRRFPGNSVYTTKYTVREDTQVDDLLALYVAFFCSCSRLLVR